MQIREPVSPQNGRFLDAEGHPVFLNGINASGQKGKEQKITRDDLVRIRDWGLNAIRYVVFWRDIEPEPGVYSDDKLAEIRQTLDWAEQLNMLVLLDMHQDLYCSPEAGGMPAWTLIEADLPHITGGPNWKGAYFLSPRVQAAFDHFWLNTPGPDGISI